MKLALFLVLVLAGSPATLAEEPAPAEARHAQDFSDVEHWVPIFEPGDRHTWQNPLGVLWLAFVDEGHHVADLGAGTGYFTRMLCETVRASGKVYAVDTSQEMLDYIDKREDLVYDNVVTVLAEPDDPKLPEGELDVILVVNTWHHIDKRVAYLGKLAKSLKPSGRVAIVDWRKAELPLGPPPEMKLSRDQVVAEFEQAGWTLTSESFMLPYQYFLLFVPPRA